MDSDSWQNDFKFWLNQFGSDDAFAQHCINAFEYAIYSATKQKRG